MPTPTDETEFRYRFWFIQSCLFTALLGAVCFGVVIMLNGVLVWSDGAAYFLYARSLFFDGNADLSNEFADLTPRLRAAEPWLSELARWTRGDPHGVVVDAPRPAGIGVLMLPFYAIGYAAELIAAAWSQRAADSYGVLPQIGFGAGTLCFGLTAFWAMLATARRAVDAPPALAAAAAAGLLLAGPTAFYLFFHPSMAHGVSLGVVAIATWLWFGLWRRGAPPRRRSMLWLGLLCGVLVTIRYQNVVFGLLPTTLVLRELWRRRWRPATITAAAGAAGAAAPILILIGSIVGGGAPAVTRPLVEESLAATPLWLGPYSFDPRSPFFIDVLISSRHGLFHWAPLWAAACFGLLWWLLRRAASAAAVLLLVFVCHVYLIGALGIAAPGAAFTDWERHWRGASSFGMRYLSECAPLLAPGLALLLSGLAAAAGRVAALAVTAAAVIWNGLLMIAYGLNALSRSDSVSYAEMAAGVARSLRSLAERW